MTSWIIKFLTLFAIWNVAIVSSTEVDKQLVAILDNSNFEYTVQASSGMKNGNWLVIFSAPWCGHCNRYVGKFANVAKQLKAEGTDLNFAKVDTSVNPLISRRFRVRGLPWIIYLKDHKMYVYRGDREIADLRRFVNGGYKNEEEFEIPDPPTIREELEAHFYRMKKDFILIYPSKIVLLSYIFSMGAIGGLFIGCLFGCCCCRRKQKVVKNKEE